jgi:uncharacterized protein YaeQ
MALTATIYNFDITLSDMDRGVYEQLALRVAQHPAESPEYLLTRVLAYCLEYTEGIAFSKGISEGDDPALFVRDLTGRTLAWIEVGWPDADRLHRGSKSAERVAIYTHRNPTTLLAQLAGKRIHRAAEIPIYAFDRGFIDAVLAQLDRRAAFELSVTERHLYLTINGQTIEGDIAEHRLSENGKG